MTTTQAAKHTPGPWRMVRNGAFDYSIMAPDKDQPEMVITIVRCEENARLISQAPALAEALAKIVELDPPCPFPPSDGRYPEWFRIFGQLKTVLRDAGVDL